MVPGLLPADPEARATEATAAPSRIEEGRAPESLPSGWKDGCPARHENPASGFAALGPAPRARAEADERSRPCEDRMTPMCCASEGALRWARPVGYAEPVCGCCCCCCCCSCCCCCCCCCSCCCCCCCCCCCGCCPCRLRCLSFSGGREWTTRYSRLEVCRSTHFGGSGAWHSMRHPPFLS